VVIDNILERFSKAVRPILLVGHGVRCAGATSALRALVNRLGAPVVTTQLGKDVLPYDHELFVGHCGPKGDRAGNFALQSADLILSLGCSLHSQTIGYEADLYAPGSYKIQVDLDRPILQRGDVPVDLQVEADVTEFLNAMLKAPAKPNSCAAWRQRCQHWKQRFAVAAEPHNVATPEINFYEFADALSESLSGHETIVTDAGSAFYVMGQAFKCKANQRYIVSGAMGAMGYALPAAIGCAATDEKLLVICVTGDGSLQLNIQELQTLKHYRPNVKLFVIKNEGYASIRNTQKGFFNGQCIGSSNDSGVSMPSIENVATAYGLCYIEVDDRKAMKAQIAKALQTPGPVVIGIRAQANQIIIPTVASVQLPNGSMRSNPLQRMSPDLPADVFAAEFEGALPSAQTLKNA
jgi:acetolactate synthase-1/2/3 large subunit